MYQETSGSGILFGAVTYAKVAGIWRHYLVVETTGSATASPTTGTTTASGIPSLKTLFTCISCSTPGLLLS